MVRAAAVAACCTTVVAARFGAGWTVNLANPAAWLVIAALIAAPAGLAAILTALGNAPG